MQGRSNQDTVENAAAATVASSAAENAILNTSTEPLLRSMSHTPLLDADSSQLVRAEDEIAPKNLIDINGNNKNKHDPSLY